MVFLVVAVIVPLLYMLRYSFSSYNLVVPGLDGQFVGLSNFKRLISDPAVWQRMKITLWFSFLAVSGQVVLGLLIAMLLNSEFRGKSTILSIILIPSMLSPITVALIWRFLLLPNYGLLLYILSRFGIVEFATGVFSNATSAFYTLVLIDLWQWTPFVMLILLAGLTSLPEEPFEAAKVDGAGGLQVFKYMTIPLLKPVLVLAILFRVITVLKTFDTVYLLTGGGPAGATEILNMYAYRINFIHWDFGYGSAIVLLVVLISFVVTIAFSKASESV